MIALSCYETAFVNLWRMHVPILRVQTRSVSWAKWLQHDKARCRWHSFLIPPLVPNTKGVNEPISTSNTRCWYLRFFSSSCFFEHFRCWLALVTLGVDVCNSNIKKCRNSSCPETSRFDVQPCLRTCNSAPQMKVYIFVGQVFYRSHVLRHIRLRSFAV